jgi:hypothetical protein
MRFKKVWDKLSSSEAFFPCALLADLVFSPPFLNDGGKMYASTVKPPSRPSGVPLFIIEKT